MPRVVLYFFDTAGQVLANVLLLLYSPAAAFSWPLMTGNLDLGPLLLLSIRPVK
jgi:hypothetical protein